MDLAIDIADDSSRVRLQILDDERNLTGEIILDAHELELVIRNMAGARAKLKPGIPRSLDPNPVFRDVTHKPVFHITVANKVSKEIVVAARHDGHGWLAFAMTPENGLQMAELLVQTAAKAATIVAPPKPKLII
jgi:hypothetical protein